MMMKSLGIRNATHFKTRFGTIPFLVMPLFLMPLFLMVIVSFVGMRSTANGQVQRVAHEPQGKLFDDIVKGLVKTNLDFNSREQLNANRTAAAPADVQQAQQGIARFAADARRLITSLRTEERYSPNVRPLIGDALRVQADADVLAQRAAYMTNISQFTDEYSNIDRQWNVLSNQLRQVPNVGARVVQEINRMNQSAAAIAKSFNVEPQMQRDELLERFFALSLDLRYLAEDVRTDLWNNPDRDKLAQQIWDLQNRTSQLTAAIQSNHRYDYVKGYYEQFFEKWMATKRNLRSTDNRYIQRNVDRISQATTRVHELLWLPPFVDGGDILYMANSLKSNVDSICDNISLTRLIGLPNSPKIFASAREFYSLCGSFQSTVSNSQKFDEIQWDFRELDVAWNELRNLIVPLNDPTTSQQIAMIDTSIMDLRDTLGEQSGVDTNQIMNVVSTIDNMSDLLYYDLNRYVGQSNRYPAAFRSQAINSAKNLHNLAHSLYSSVVRNQDVNSIRSQSQQLVSQWNDLQQYLAKIPASDREVITRTSRHIAPALAKLQVMYY